MTAATPELLRIFIGADPRQVVSYNVLQFSIVRRSSKPVQITPLIIEQLPITREGLTPFSFSRYLVPWLCNYQGWAIFMDADMLVVDDIAKLFTYADPQYDVMVSKNPHRFEWASVMLFNCGACKALTPEYVQNTDSGNLYNFKWTSETKIGDLPRHWNHLVGYDNPRTDASLVHYTQGNPMFPETGDCEYSGEWFREQRDANYFRTWDEIMGPSVHAGWCGTKLLPLHRKEPILIAARTEIEQKPFALIPRPANITGYSKQYPSDYYQQRLHAFKVRHLFGDPKANQTADQTFKGLGLLELLGTIKSHLKRPIYSMLDYGSGKGYQYQPITIQGENNSSYPDIKSFFDLKKLNCYDPAYPLLDKLPPHNSDLVLCTNVLECCPETDLPWIIHDIFSQANEQVFLKINSYASDTELATGEPLHCTVRPSQWWFDLLLPIVQQYPEILVSCFIKNADQKYDDLSELFQKHMSMV